MADHKTANRIGFFILGLTNNFGYVVMLAAAFDLLKSNHVTQDRNISDGNSTSYCNPHSTSTILLADTIPSLLIKLSYPFLLLRIAASHKCLAIAFLSGASFLVTGFAGNETVIFIGVILASTSAGLGESTYLTNIPLYGDVSLSGWSMGTGASGLLGAMAYAVMRMLLSIKVIMIILLVIPLSMLLAYFCVIVPTDDQIDTTTQSTTTGSTESNPDEDERDSLLSGRTGERNYGTSEIGETPGESDFNFKAKLRSMPGLAKYFFPLLLVYFAEYFINQGLYELIYFPEVSYLDHAAQYSWFQVSYQLGVLISRSSLDLFKIKNLWTMSVLQALNALLFLSHAAKLIHIPGFHITILLIIYEGLLGGFTYINTYHRLKNELPRERREFSMGVVTIADSIGIVTAGLIALPVHEALCKLY